MHKPLGIMKEQCLITGGSGFLGQALMEALARRYDVCTLGRHTTGAAVHIRADLGSEIPVLPDEFFSLVVHNAGLAHHEALKKTDPDIFFRVNAAGTEHLLQALSRLTRPPACLVLISTVAVYGLSEGHDIDEEHPFAATDDPYSLSKRKAEEFMLHYAAGKNIPCFIFRLPLVIGRNHKGNMRKLVDAFRKGRYLSVKGNHARKSMVRADDVAALIAALPKGSGGIYNLSDGAGHSLNEIETVLAHKTGTRPLGIPGILLQLAALAGSVIRVVWKGFPLSTGVYRKLTSTLTFSNARASQDLDWKPRDVLDYLKDTPTEAL